MKKYLNILITVLLIVLQVTVLSRIKLFGLNYNLALVSVIVVASVAETKISVLNAVIAGILYDVYACYNVGWHLVMFVLITLMMILVVKYMYKGSIATTVVITGLLTIVTELIFYYFGYLHNGNVYSSMVLVKVILPQTLINILVTFLVFPIFKAINSEKKKFRY